MTKYINNEEVSMKIGIIGGGSIGLLFAHYLRNQHHVTIYVRSNEQAEKLSTDGLLFEKGKVRSNEHVFSTVFSAWNGQEDLTIIAVKQYHLPKVIEELIKTNPNYRGTLLFLQNGMGHLKWLKEMDVPNIFLGTVEHGSYKVNANHVIHTGEGRTKLALFKGNDCFVMREIIELGIKDFPFVFEEDYYKMLTDKLIINAVINPLTAVLNVQNGELLENQHYYHLFKQLFTEISFVLDIADDKTAFTQLKDVCKKTAANRSSMLKDLDEKRPTEVDAILGYILEKGKEKEMNAPLTESFYHLIKGKEHKEGGN